jgi:Zn-finger nucleic acid-binding protein
MTTVTFACPECQTNLKTSQRITSDQDIRCPKCGTVFPAPPEMDFLEDAADFDEPASAKASPRSNRTKRVILLSALIVVLFTAGTAYMAWHTIENWGHNEGTGREDPLAFIPADSTLVLGVDLGALADHPAWADEVEKGIRSLNRTPIFWDDCKTNTGIEFRELFDRVIIALKLEGLNPNEPPHLTLIAHSKLPFNQNRIRDSEKDMFRYIGHGKTYYKRNDGLVMDPTWLFMPSDRVLVLSNLLQSDIEMLMEKDGTEPMIPAEEVRPIRELQANVFWAAVPWSESIRENFGRTSLLLAKMSPELAPVMQTLSHAKAAGAYARWEENQIALTLKVACADEAAARESSTHLQKYWDKHPNAKQGLTFLLTQLLRLSKEQQEIMQEILGQAKFDSEAADLRMTSRATPPPPESLVPIAQQLSNILGFGQGPPGNPGFIPPPGLRGGPRRFAPDGPPKQPPLRKV